MQILADKLLVLQRHTEFKNETIGMMLDSDGIVSHTLEDGYIQVKVAGKTRIWAGIYPLTTRREDSPLTMKYRAKFDWFEYHIMIANVRDFKYTYIHIGNFHTDTDACVLVADSYTAGSTSIQSSTQNYEKFYKKHYESINAGGWHIWVRDENYLRNYSDLQKPELWTRHS